MEASCCESKFFIYLAIIVLLVMFAGLMSGLTLGLMSLSLVDLEVLAKSGTPKDRRYAGNFLSGTTVHLFFFFLDVLSGTERLIISVVISCCKLSNSQPKLRSHPCIVVDFVIKLLSITLESCLRQLVIGSFLHKFPQNCPHKEILFWENGGLI